VAPAYHLAGQPYLTIGDPHRETKTVATLNLPAGRYAVKADLDLANYDGDDQGLGCNLAGVSFDGGITSGSNIIGPFEDRTMSLASTTTLSGPAAVRVECNAFKLEVYGYLEALRIQ
jgi:hypothetical protein